MEKVYFRKYSESFRKMVVAEYEAGASVNSLRRRYGIGSRTSILKWIKRYATAGLRHEVVVIQRAEERQQVKKREQELEARIRELEAGIAQLALDKLMLETILEVASEEVGQDLKKKHAPRSSNAPTAKDNQA